MEQHTNRDGSSHCGEDHDGVLTNEIEQKAQRNGASRPQLGNKVINICYPGSVPVVKVLAFKAEGSFYCGIKLYYFKYILCF